MKTINPNTIAIALIAACALNGQTAGSVAGTVLENGATPLAGATVTYAPVANVTKNSAGQITRVGPTASGSVQSRADGTFSITGLPAGRYIICAQGTLPIHISSCAWNTTDHRVTIASGQSLTGLRLSVNRGSLLAITIADSSGCVAKNSKASVYVSVGSMLQQAYRLPTASGTYQYQALVPQQVPIKLTPNHPCSFADPSGNALPAGLSIPPVQGESASETMTAR